MADLAIILSSVTAVSLAAFVGIIFVGLKDAFLKSILMALVGFASGSLIGGTFIHLLPEAFEKTGFARNRSYQYTSFSPKKEITELKEELISRESRLRKAYDQKQALLAHVLHHVKNFYRRVARKKQT